MFGDQFYWSRRIRELGIGAAVPLAGLSAGGLAAALHEALEPTVAAVARSVAREVTSDGAAIAARRMANARLAAQRPRRLSP